MNSGKYYLLIYNALQTAGWLGIFLLWLFEGLQLTPRLLLLLNIFQGAMVLDILHAATGLVRTALFTTTVQISSRILVLVLLNILPANAHITLAGFTGIHLILPAWAMTESVRFAYYTALSLGRHIPWLTWLRYSMFYLLYPVGVAGEIWIILSFMAFRQWTLDFTNIALAVILVAYIPGFTVMYRHMIRQRQKKFAYS